MKKIKGIKISGVDINNIPTLSQKETRELIKKVQQKDHNSQDALDTLVKHNLRLVLTVVGRLNRQEKDVEDMFQIGCVGLIDAINGFNLDYEIKFSTYAFPMISGTIKTHMARDKTVRTPRRLQNNLYRLYIANKEMTNRLQREPTDIELMEELGISSEELAQTRNSNSNTSSLFSLVLNDGDGEPIQLIDTLSNEDEGQEDWVDSICLKECIDRLSKREQLVLRGVYFQDRSQKELAHSIGLSQAQVSRVRNNALNKLKKMIS